jgi:hypothetical protein
LCSHTSLVSHVIELLNLVFSDDRVSFTAFSILEFSNARLVQAAIKCGCFGEVARRALLTNTVDQVYVNRLSSVMISFLWVDATSIDVVGGILFQLFEFMANPAVYSLFQFLCRANPRLAPVQEWLLSHAFFDVLLQELSVGRADNFRRVACFRVIALCASNPVLQGRVCSPRFISALGAGVGSGAPCVEDARWLALDAIYCTRTVELMRGYFPLVIEVIAAGDRGQRCCSALALLKKMIDLDQLLLPEALAADLPRVVMGLIVERPDHSILQQVLRPLIVALIENKATRAKAVTDCGPLIVVAAKTENRNLAASVGELVRELMKGGGFKELKAIPQFGDLVKKTKERAKLMEARYGGPT